MEQKKVFAESLLKKIDLGEYGGRLNDYRNSGTYICDAICEIADEDTSVYNSDVFKFISAHPEMLEEVVSEGLYEVGVGMKYDLMSHGRAAEFLWIEQDLCAHMADALILCAVDFLRYDLNVNEISASLADNIVDWAKEADSDDRMSDIPDKIVEFMEEESEDDNIDLFKDLDDIIDGSVGAP